MARLRVTARRAGLADVGTQGQHVRFGPLDLRESQRLRLTRLYPGSLVKPALHTVLVPRPKTAKVGGQPLRDREVLAWARQVIEAGPARRPGCGGYGCLERPDRLTQSRPPDHRTGGRPP